MLCSTSSVPETEYIAVMPEDDNDEGTVYLQMETEDGQPELTNIETDEEYEYSCRCLTSSLMKKEFEDLLGEEDLYFFNMEQCRIVVIYCSKFREYGKRTDYFYIDGKIRMESGRFKNCG